MKKFIVFLVCLTILFSSGICFASSEESEYAYISYSDTIAYEYTQNTYSFYTGFTILFFILLAVFAVITVFLFKKKKSLLKKTISISLCAVFGILGILFFASLSLYNKAVIYSIHNDNYSALSELNSIPIKTDTVYSDIHYEKGNIAYKDGYLEKAVFEYENASENPYAASKADRIYFEMKINSAKDCANDGNPQKALDMLDDLYDFSQNNEDKNIIINAKADICINSGDDIKAIEIMVPFNNNENITPKLEDTVIKVFNSIYEKDGLLSACAFLADNIHTTGLKTLLETYYPALYENGINYIDIGDIDTAKEYFSILSSVSNYKNSKIIYEVLNSSDLNTLKTYLNSEYKDIACLVISSDNNLLKEFLRGYWEDGSIFYFEIDEDSYLNTNIPADDFESVWDIENGILGFYDEYGLSKKVYKIKILSPNSIDIYSYKDNNTYILKRK